MLIIYYFIAYILLPAFFILSIYNLVQLERNNREDELLRSSINIAIECTIIFIGFLLFSIWHKGEITETQLWFCGHISIFLVLTGITSIIPTAKRIEKIR